MLTPLQNKASGSNVPIQHNGLKLNIIGCKVSDAMEQPTINFKIVVSILLDCISNFGFKTV